MHNTHINVNMSHVHSYNRFDIFFTDYFKCITERPGGALSGQIHLYSIVIAGGFQASVFSLLSEKHDANFLTFWLREFIRLGASIPNEYIVDMSFALLNAGAIAFGNRANLEEYVDDLFHGIMIHSHGGDEIYQNAFKLKNPPCHVRIDINHLMHNVTSCPALKTVRRKVKELFVRSVALMILETSFYTLERHIRAVLFVSLSQTRGLYLN